jgi:hypothetical protein
LNALCNAKLEVRPIRERYTAREREGKVESPKNPKRDTDRERRVAAGNQVAE